MYGRVIDHPMIVLVRIAVGVVCIVSVAVLYHVSNAQETWRGVDLSYVNELHDCGVVYRLGGVEKDPYQIFSELGANVVRLRLWHTPTNDPFPTEYSGTEDVKRGIERAKRHNMRVLLDFHYSDTWADPGRQLIPEAWRHAESTEEQAELLFTYTAETLLDLSREGLWPDFVQIGNEINSEMLRERPVEEGDTIDWQRQVTFVNAGLLAVQAIERATGESTRTIIHIAQPENVEWWFDSALAAGLLDFDIIGISYYPKWSRLPIEQIDSAVDTSRRRYGHDVVIVETAYPWTMRWNDNRHNILWTDSVLQSYPATRRGQRDYLIDLMSGVLRGGGLGVVYWEPAWVSSRCKHSDSDSAGSSWENATFFTFDRNNVHEGADFLGYDYGALENALDSLQ